MAETPAPRTRSSRWRPLALTVPATLLIVGCGSTADPPDDKPHAAQSGETSAGAIQVRYVATDPEYAATGARLETDVIAQGSDHSRAKITWFVERGRVDESVVIVRDHNRALAYDALVKKPTYTVMEAVDEHPDDVTPLATPLEPGSKEMDRLCPKATRSGQRTILGRAAVGYDCSPAQPDPYLQPANVWLDKASGMVLEAGADKAVEIITEPAVDESTFSVTPPAGAKVDLVKATGKVPTPPGEGPGDDLSPQDKLLKIADTAPHATYYLGPEFAGDPLTSVDVYDDDTGSEVPDDLKVDPRQSLWLTYGEALEVYTTPFDSVAYRHTEGCRRLRDLRGVPTVELSDAILLFTSDLVISVGPLRGPGQVARAGASLGEVGKAPTGKALPAPPARYRALIDTACGAKPGDHGPRAVD